MIATTHHGLIVGRIERLRDRDASDDQSIDVVISALADTTRREALRMVSRTELSAGDLATAFPHISRPAVSQHLRVLSDAGLVAVRADGRRRMYRARREALTPVAAFIDAMWSDRLDHLKRVAEQTQAEEDDR